MKQFISMLIMATMLFSAGSAALTNSAIAMTSSPYVKWQSREKQPGLLNEISAFLSGVSDTDSLIEQINKSGKSVVPEEIKHLTDVKNVFSAVKKTNKASILLLAGGIVLLIFLRGMSFAFRAAYRICFLLIMGFLAVGAFNYFKFDLSFEMMHKLLFRDGTWTFPPDSLLIKFFPLDFWKNSAIFLYTGSLAQIAALGVFFKLLVKKIF